MKIVIVGPGEGNPLTGYAAWVRESDGTLSFVSGRFADPDDFAKAALPSGQKEVIFRAGPVSVDLTTGAVNWGRVAETDRLKLAEQILAHYVAVATPPMELATRDYSNFLT